MADTNLKYLRKFVSKLKKVQPILVDAGWKLTLLIDENWQHGKGADDQRLAPLSPKYAQKKRERTGRAKADLHLTGNMAQSLVSRPKGKVSAVVTFSSEYERRKAEGNAERRPNMMKTSDRIDKKIVKFVAKRLLEKGL